MDQLPVLTNIANDTKLDYTKEWGYYKNTNVMYLQKGTKRYRLQNIFNFITQAVNIDISLILKGLKVVGDDQAYIEILNAIYKDMRKDLLTLYMAIYGNGYIKMEIDEEQQRISLKVLTSPQTDFIKDADGNVIQGTYTYIQRDAENKTKSVKEVYTADKIEKYIDGKLVEQKDNQYGFVPIYHLMFGDCGEKYGVNSFDHIAIQQDIINAYANVIYQIGNKMLDPIYLIKGNFSPKDRETVTKEFAKNIFDGLNVVTTTADGGIEVVTGGLAETDKALAFLDRIQANIEQNLPELLLSKLSDKNVSGYALSMMLLGLITKINGARENTARALRTLNGDIYSVLLKWGQIPAATENFAEVKFDEIFDFTQSDRIAEVKQLLDMGLITEDVAKQRLGIDWGGDTSASDNNDKAAAPAAAAAEGDGSGNTDEGAGDNKPGLLQRIITAIKQIFGAE